LFQGKRNERSRTGEFAEGKGPKGRTMQSTTYLEKVSPPNSEGGSPTEGKMFPDINQGEFFSAHHWSPTKGSENWESRRHKKGKNQRPIGRISGLNVPESPLIPRN